MRPTRLALPVVLAFSLCAEESRETEKRKKAEITTREIFAFPSGGTLILNQSFGEVYVEGWDQTDIELTTIRSSKKAYKEAEIARAYEELERIAINPVKEKDRFTISTEVERNRFGRGPGNVQVVYRIKVPFHCNLQIHHEIGQVKVKGVAGHMDVTTRVGEIQLRLPTDAPYAVDARSRAGEVNSEISEWKEPRATAGEPLPAAPPGDVRKLHLRIGVGSIKIKKQWRDKEVPRPARPVARRGPEADIG
jgi:hypothetical protein